MIRVKICGVTARRDIAVASRNGCDWIGLNFVQGSPRELSMEQAVEIVRDKPKGIEIVAVFANAKQEKVNAVLENLPIDYLQFHGAEEETWCQQFDLPYFKSLSIEAVVERPSTLDSFGSAYALLLDSMVGDRFGGTGVTFDWSNWPREASRALILAGGLTPNNVREAIEICRPYGVDVASGVEKTRGIKDADLIQAFVREVRSHGG